MVQDKTLEAIGLVVRKKLKSILDKYTPEYVELLGEMMEYYHKLCGLRWAVCNKTFYEFMEDVTIEDPGRANILLQNVPCFLHGTYDDPWHYFSIDMDTVVGIFLEGYCHQNPIDLSIVTDSGYVDEIMVKEMMNEAIDLNPEHPGITIVRDYESRNIDEICRNFFV